MKILINKIKKEAINQLPVVIFEKKIVVIGSPFEAERAVAFLSRQPIVGIDTETKPSFRKGKTNPVALLQISTSDICFLFRLNQLGFPDCLRHFLANDQVLKVGLSLKDDIASLCKRAPVHLSPYIELQQFVSDFGIEDKSLQKIYAILFNQKISKSQRLTNWEADFLTEKQQAYAATDAWACLRIYNELNALRQAGYQIHKIDEPLEQEQTSIAST